MLIDKCLTIVCVSAGHPSVTMAPNCDSDSALPVFQRPDPPTQLSLLSQSMMDQQVCVSLCIFVFQGSHAFVVCDSRGWRHYVFGVFRPFVHPIL